MSREIDMSKPESWDEDDVRYLQDRGQLPADYDDTKKLAKPNPMRAEDAVPDTPAIGDVGTATDFGGYQLPYEDEDWDDISVGDLRDELKERGLSTQGKKPELIARLQEDVEKKNEGQAAG